ncbi:BatA domain-containing protein [Fibrella sp. WM1]|uniref:BatA domain-containing protein n=1 Tax=Fibrella musci TaxID=3242485 RepID=UPI0035203AD3
MFQNPGLLWGMLAVAVPIALHFWHQQQAQPMPWAMLRWLETPNQPPKRGFRFDNLWLLLLRCLLLIVLALLLARPELPQTGTTKQGAIHLVEPNRQVVDAFKFELEQARQRGDQLVWVTDTPTPIDELGTLPSADRATAALNPLTVQAAIEQFQSPQTRLHLYLRNTVTWTDAPPINVPTGFVLHALPVRAAAPTADRVVALASGRFLGLDSQGRLASLTQKTANQRVVATAPLPVLIQFRQPDERRTVRAALAALTATYGLTFLIDEQPVANKSYGWVLTEQPVRQPNPGTVYLTTAPITQADDPAVTYLARPLTTVNPLVANGLLPEQLGNTLAMSLGLTAGPAPLSQQAFAGLFVPTPTLSANATATASLAAHPRNTLQTGLLVLFLSLLLAERWWALRRGV